MSEEDNPFEDPSISGAAASAAPPPTSEPSWMSAPPPEAETTNPISPGGSKLPPATSQQPGWFSSPAPAAPAYREDLPGAPPMDISIFQLPKAIQAMRLANVLSSFFLALIAVFKLMSSGANISAGVLSVYLFAFGVLLFAFELHLSCFARAIAANLGFMYRATGRATFMILVGMLCFSGFSPIGDFTGVLLVSTALYNGFILWKYPNYEKSCRVVDLGEQ